MDARYAQRCASIFQVKRSDFPPKRGDAAEMDKRNACFLRQREEVLLKFLKKLRIAQKERSRILCHIAECYPVHGMLSTT